MNSPAIERVIEHANRLADPTIHRSHRLALLRLVIDAAHNAHSEEVQQLDELKAAVADPSLSSAFGEPVV